MIHLTRSILLLALLCVALSMPGYCAGGVYFDEIKVTNNGKTLIWDDFNDGDTKGWKIVRPDVRTVQTSKKPVDHCLYMNRLTDINTAADYNVPKTQVGLLEVKFLVNLPPFKEQLNYARGKIETTRIDLMTSPSHWFYIGIELRPREELGRLFLRYIKESPKFENGQKISGKDEYFHAPAPIIPCCEWTEIVLRIDSKSGTATVFVNGSQQISCEYTPEPNRKFTSLDLTTWMGDQETIAKRPGETVQPQPKK